MISTKHLLDPELWAMAETPLLTELTDANLDTIRKNFSQQIPSLADSLSYGVNRTEIFIPQDGGPDVRCLLYRPVERKNCSGAGYLHIHGGGYLFGSPDASDANNLLLASKIGVVIISIDYRLAPEHPIPAPLDDCYTGLGWLHQNAENLGLDRNRIGIGGESAGGGLAAALAIKARDAGEYEVCFQALTYPMLDDRTGEEDHYGDPLVGEFVWTRALNQFAWDRYLKSADRQAPQVPARVKSYEGLPATWMFTASMDLFRDENIAFARKLMEAGVTCELIIYPGACHAFQRIMSSELSKRYRVDFIAAVERGLR
jgi:acetyl esterase/lipase